MGTRERGLGSDYKPSKLTPLLPSVTGPIAFPDISANWGPRVELCEASPHSPSSSNCSYFASVLESGHPSLVVDGFGEWYLPIRERISVDFSLYKDPSPAGRLYSCDLP